MGRVRVRTHTMLMSLTPVGSTHPRGTRETIGRVSSRYREPDARRLYCPQSRALRSLGRRKRLRRLQRTVTTAHFCWG